MSYCWCYIYLVLFSFSLSCFYLCMYVFIVLLSLSLYVCLIYTRGCLFVFPVLPPVRLIIVFFFFVFSLSFSLSSSFSVVVSSFYFPFSSFLFMSRPIEITKLSCKTAWTILPRTTPPRPKGTTLYLSWLTLSVKPANSSFGYNARVLLSGCAYLTCFAPSPQKHSTGRGQRPRWKGAKGSGVLWWYEQKIIHAIQQPRYVW